MNEVFDNFRVLGLHTQKKVSVPGISAVFRYNEERTEYNLLRPYKELGS
jgi:hypothetical protein